MLSQNTEQQLCVLLMVIQRPAPAGAFENLFQ